MRWKHVALDFAWLTREGHYQGLSVLNERVKRKNEGRFIVHRCCKEVNVCGCVCAICYTVCLTLSPTGQQWYFYIPLILIVSLALIYHLSLSIYDADDQHIHTVVYRHNIWPSAHHCHTLFLCTAHNRYIIIYTIDYQHILHHKIIFCR